MFNRNADKKAGYVRTDTRNWLEAAVYDLESARHMLSSGRYLYVVFLCHLTLEKLLKAVVAEVTGQTAPRSHDLIYLVKRSGISPEPRYLDFIGKLNNASIPTRYPSDIREAIREYTEQVADSYLKQTEEVATWLKRHPSLIE